MASIEVSGYIINSFKLGWYLQEQNGRNKVYTLQGLPCGSAGKELKNPLAMRETWVQLLGWEDLLVKGKATHSSIMPKGKGYSLQ